MDTAFQKALVPKDNFSGQTTPTVFVKVEEQGIIVAMVPAGTTDRLQPPDVSKNKTAKDFLYKIRSGSGMDMSSTSGLQQGEIWELLLEALDGTSQRCQS